MQVFILARTQNEITEQIYPALTDAGDSDKIDVSVTGYATSTDNLAGQIQATRPDAIFVRMTLSNRGDETALLENLAAHRLPLIVLLPRGRKGLAESLQALPGVAAVAVEPVDYAALLRKVAGEPAPDPTPQAPPESVCAQTPPANTQAPPATTAAPIVPTNGRQAAPAPSTTAAPAALTAHPPLPPNAPSSASTSASTLSSSSISTLSSSPSRLIAFTSGTGGTGKSTLAGSLAWMLAQDKTRTAILLSLGNPPAAVSHCRGIARWPHVGLFLSGEEPFERVVQQSSDGLPVAIAPGDLALYDEIGTRTPTEPGAVARLVEAAAAHFDLVILDLPPTLTGWALHPLLAARDHDMDIVITARPTVADQAGVVQAMMLLQSLHRGTTSYSAGRLLLVLNDYHRGRDITRKEFTTGVSQLTACPLLGAVVPHNAVVRLAQNEGLPLGLVEETGDVAKEVDRLARALGWEMGREGVEVEAEVERGEGALVSRAKAKKKRPALALPGIRFKLTD